jgi:hypothetical protein
MISHFEPAKYLPQITHAGREAGPSSRLISRVNLFGCSLEWSTFCRDWRRSVKGIFGLY